MSTIDEIVSSTKVPDVVSEEELWDKHDQAQDVAKSKYSDLSSTTISTLRRRAKTDLFFLCNLLGYDKLSVNFHGHFCNWLTISQNERYRMILLPRGHYKSTIMTLAEAIQIVLPDDKGDQPWPRNLGTDCRLLIAHETAEGASRFLGAIQQQFLTNPLLLALFPDAIPIKGKHKLNSQELVLPRNVSHPEPTIDTMGVGAKGQGRHYNYIKLDDIYGDKARDSKAERETTLTWVDNIQSFFSAFKYDHLDIVGTRWAFDDVYAHLMNVYGKQLKRYIRPIEELDENGNKQVIFPEEFSQETLQIIKKNKKIWSAQYCNNPELSSTEFQQDWLRYFYWTGENNFKYVYKVLGKEYTDTLNVRNTDVNILIDPAMTGKGAIVVTGTDDKGRTFVYEAIKEDWNPPQQVDLIFRLVQRWQPRNVVIEEVLFSALFKPWIEREMILRNKRFHIEGVKTGGKAKDARVRGLANFFASGNLIFNSTQLDLITEFKQFGATEDYHLLDALAYGPQIWRRGSYGNVENERKASVDELLADRDPITGYSFVEDE